MAISNAIPLDAVSAVLGYKLLKGDFRATSPNLPQRIGIFGEANSANQVGLVVDQPTLISSAADAAELFGYGSPIHSVARILFSPLGGNRIPGIPVYVYPQLQASVDAFASKRRIVVTGTATKTITHTLVINGRTNLDGKRYSFTVVAGDTEDQIIPKIVTAVQNVLSAPVTAANVDNLGTPGAELTAKWIGLTSEEIDIVIDNAGDGAGLTYLVSNLISGAGLPDIEPSLALLGNEWTTLIINTYGSNFHTEFNVANGQPLDIPTGRFSAERWLPFHALWGSTEQDKDTLAALVSSQSEQVTNVLCPAPNSKGFTWEAAANGCVIQANIAHNRPNLDAMGGRYPDMPIPSDGNIGDMSVYQNRDFLAKNGCSTVILKNGVYEIVDFITTYNKVGEQPPQFRFVRSMVQDFNVKYTVFLKKESFLVGKSLAADNDLVEAENVVKPKQWRAEVFSIADDLTKRNLIIDAPFMKESVDIGTGDTNPDRLETFFSYKRSPYLRILSTTAEAGFAFNL